MVGGARDRAQEMEILWRQADSSCAPVQVTFSQVYLFETSFLDRVPGLQARKRNGGGRGPTAGASERKVRPLSQSHSPFRLLTSPPPRASTASSEATPFPWPRFTPRVQ